MKVGPPRADDIDRGAVTVRLAHETVDRRRGGAVENGDGREVDDVGFRMLGDPVERRADRGGRAEEEGARDPVDDHVRVGR